jgi:formiminoglutamase
LFVVLWRLALGGGSASVKRMSWPNLTDLIVDATTDAPVGLVGAPLGTGSVTPGRCDLAPALLRATLKRIGRYDVETGRELASRIADHGDAAVAGMSIEAATAPIRDACAASVVRRALTLVAGGNNAVTRPAVHALGAGLNLAIDQLGLITLDAHFDLRGTSGGLGNGNPVRALREDGLPGRNIAQVGLAPFANSEAMHRDAVEGGHLVVTIGQVRRDGIAQAISTALAHVAHCRAIIVDCDIDVIDRGQFPGAPGARPGGMAAHDFFAAVRMLAACPAVRLIDLTEWDPPLDPSDLSALTAARWVAECLAGFEQR